jgi:hypothetical protein
MESISRASKGIICSLKSFYESDIFYINEIIKPCILSAAKARDRAFFGSTFRTERWQRCTLRGAPVVAHSFSTNAAYCACMREMIN